MVPYNDPRDLWQVYSAERERTRAMRHLERLARQARLTASDSVSPPPRVCGRALLRAVRLRVRAWIPALMTGRSGVPCGECCA